MVTIYHRPADLPDAVYAVRGFTILAGVAIGERVRPGPLLGTAETLEGARLLVPPECDTRLERSPADNPTVVETWM